MKEKEQNMKLNLLREKVDGANFNYKSLQVKQKDLSSVILGQN